MATAAITVASTTKVLDNIYTAAACTDTADVLNAVATIWERVGGSMSGLLGHKAAYGRMATLARRYHVLARKQSAADAEVNAKHYEVAQFERLFTQLLND